MIGLFRLDGLQDRSGLELLGIGLVVEVHCFIQRERVENGCLCMMRPAATFITKWQNEPKFNFKQSHLCFSEAVPVQRSYIARLRLENGRRS